MLPVNLMFPYLKGKYDFAQKLQINWKDTYLRGPQLLMRSILRVLIVISLQSLNLNTFDTYD